MLLFANLLVKLLDPGFHVVDQSIPAYTPSWIDEDTLKFQRNCVKILSQVNMSHNNRKILKGPSFRRKNQPICWFIFNPIAAYFRYRLVSDGILLSNMCTSEH